VSAATDDPWGAPRSQAEAPSQPDPPMRAGDRSQGDLGSKAVPAGRVGRAHGLDGSFYVAAARSRLLALGTTLTVDGRVAKVVRQAGTNERPLIRLEGIDDRAAAEAIRGVELTVDLVEAPELEEGEWWASELEGCEVVDGELRVGIVTRLLELPSCEALEVELVRPESEHASQPEGASRPAPASQPDPASRPERAILIPMVRDAIRKVDPASRRIEVDMSFLAETR
jgi:16S rRNA processing protein RimM